MEEPAVRNSSAPGRMRQVRGEMAMKPKNRPAAAVTASAVTSRIRLLRTGSRIISITVTPATLPRSPRNTPCT